MEYPCILIRPSLGNPKSHWGDTVGLQIFQMNNPPKFQYKLFKNIIIYVKDHSHLVPLVVLEPFSYAAMASQNLKFCFFGIIKNRCQKFCLALILFGHRKKIVNYLRCAKLGSLSPALHYQRLFTFSSISAICHWGFFAEGWERPKIFVEKIIPNCLTRAVSLTGNFFSPSDVSAVNISNKTWFGTMCSFPSGALKPCLLCGW